MGLTTVDKHFTKWLPKCDKDAWLGCFVTEDRIWIC